MNLDFIFAARNKAAIKLRGLSYFSLRSATRGSLALSSSRLRAPCDVRTVALVLPRDASEADLGDSLNRLAWFLGGTDAFKGPKITIIGPERLSMVMPVAPKAQRNYLSRLSATRFASLSDVHLRPFDAVMIWRAKSALHPRLWSTVDRWHIGDPMIYNGSDNGNFMRIAERLPGKKSDEEIREISTKNFQELILRFETTEGAAVLGTGPSLNELDLDSVRNRAVVVCNSIVKNVSLLERLKPAAVCFADPVFHFGPSEYAATFRDDLVRAVERFGCFAIIPQGMADLLLRHYPELSHRLIGVKMIHHWEIPSKDALIARGTSNILTMLMLPIAASLADDIWVAGCDGRKPDEKYFWKHNADAQYEGLMQTAFLTHPSFFRDRVYADYYEKHCHLLEDQLTTFERAGKVIHSITRSHIPALTRRKSMRVK